VTSRRELLLAVGLCTLGAVLVLLGVDRTWVVLEDRGGLTLQELHRSVSGATLAPGLRALGWVALAGVLALAATRQVGRVLTGAVLVVVGAAAVVVSGTHLHRAHLLEEAGRELHTCATNGPPCRPPAGIQLPTLVAHTAPVWLCLLGAALVTVAGLLTTVRGRRWSGLGSSYEAPGAAAPEPVTDKGVWDALDRGDDPTA
jgi:uncharacterized membrane protein (TIGR02234 family)